jgi:hypothetical protein
MLPYIYGLTSLCVLVVIIRRPNPISMLSLYGAGTIIYGIPLYFGYTAFITRYVPTLALYSAELDWRVYAIFFAAQSVFFAASLFPDRPQSIQIRPDSLIFPAVQYTLSIYIFLFLALLGVDKLFIDKLTRIGYMPVFYHFCYMLTVAAFILQALYGERSTLKYMIAPGLFTLLDVFMGYRTTAFLGGVSVAIAYFSTRTEPIPAKRKMSVVFWAVLATAAAFVYKPVYFSLARGEFQMGNVPRYVQTSLIGSEPFVTVGVLNEAIVREPSLPENYLIRSLAAYLPFYEQAGGERLSFNNVVQSALFANTSWGLASTNFGELYLVGGWLAIGGYLLAQLAFLRARPPSHPFWATFYYFIGPHILFFSYRNDWHVVLGVLRLYLMTAIGVYGVYIGLAALRSASRVAPDSPVSDP